MALKRWFQSALALAMVATGVAVVQTPAHAIGEVYGPYILLNAASWRLGAKQCIDNPRSNLNDNTVMTIYNCNLGRNQQWYNETAVTRSDFWTFNEVSRKCLTVRNASTAQGEKVIQYTCTSGTNERWTYRLVDDNTLYIMTIAGRQYTSHLTFEIENLKSGLCLSTNNGAMTSGTQLVQVGCRNVSPDRWIQFKI
jgi:hypothetical protein